MNYKKLLIEYLKEYRKDIDFGLSNNREDVRQRNRFFKTFKVKTL